MDQELRHQLKRSALEGLYRQFDNFIADLTFDEYKAKEIHIKEIQTLIHQRIRNTNF